MAKDASFVERAVTRLIEAELAEPMMIQGCPVEEIARLEKDLGVVLPGAYRQFLTRMGRSAGRFLTGTDFLIADLGGLRLQAQQSLHETKAGVRLEVRHFVFAVHQGYEFLFFDAQESDDPAVWHYEAGDCTPQKVFSHFSEWLDACVSDEIDAHSAL